MEKSCVTSALTNGQLMRQSKNSVIEQIAIVIHSVAINEFPKWQTLFHLQRFKYI